MPTGAELWADGVKLLKERYGGGTITPGWILEYVATDAVNQWVQWGGAMGGITVASPASDGLRLFGGSDFANDTNRLAAWFKRKLPRNAQGKVIGWAVELEYRRNDAAPPADTGGLGPGTASQFYSGNGTGLFQPDIISTTGPVTSSPDLATMNANINGGRSAFCTAYSGNADLNSQLRYNILPSNVQQATSPNEFPFTAGVWHRIRWEMVSGTILITVTNLGDGSVKSWTTPQQSNFGDVWGLYQQPHRDVNVRNVRVYVKPGTIADAGGGGTDPIPDPDTVPRAFPEPKRVIEMAPAQVQTALDQVSGTLPGTLISGSDKAAPVRPGDRIRPTDGALGTVSFRSGLVGTQADPIIVEAKNGESDINSVTCTRVNFNGKWCFLAGIKMTGTGTKVYYNGSNNRVSRLLMQSCGLFGYSNGDISGCIADRIEIANYKGIVLPSGVQAGQKFQGMKFTHFYIHDHTLADGSNEAIQTMMTAGRDASGILFDRWLLENCANPNPNNTGEKELFSLKIGTVTCRNITFTNCRGFRLVVRNSDNCVLEKIWMDGTSMIVVHGKNHRLNDIRHQDPTQVVVQIENGDTYSGEYLGGCATDTKVANRTSLIRVGTSCNGGHAACEQVTVENVEGKIELGGYNVGSGQTNKPIRNVTLRNNQSAAVIKSTAGAPASGYTQTGVGANTTTVTKLTPAEVGYNAP